jgi:cobalt-zinc-cadmium efflux system protein
MAHDHAHHTAPADLSKGHRKSFIIGICLNLAFVVAEVVFGLIYNSMALLTDAGHNAGDVISLVLSLVAFWMAGRGSTPVFTYGYKKTTILAALINSVVLLIAIGILGYESVSRLLHPEAVEGGIIAWIAGLGILVNGLSALLFYRSRSSELNSKSAYLHLLADALVSLGVVVAGVVMHYTKWYWLDPVAGIIIMLVILVSTWKLLSESFKMTIDAVPAGLELEHIKEIILRVKHVAAVGHVHVWPLSTTENALTAHVVLDHDLGFDSQLKVIEEIKHELLHHQVHHATIEMKKSIT